MDAHLQRLYRENTGPVAFMDESYREDGAVTYYIVATVLVAPDYLSSTRSLLRNYYSGETMHAAPMYHRREFASLRGGIDLAARHHDGADIVVHTPIAAGDRFGAEARRRCLAHVLPLLHAEDEVNLFVLDSFNREDANEADRRIFRDLRREGRLDRATAEHHTRPSNEPLLGLPDLLAWAYRQEYARQYPEWFEPFREHTRVHRL
ncbi:MAG: hypothetical protein ACK5LO_10235 [Leucobacter sp.]